jgi:hypothetical protein
MLNFRKYRENIKLINLKTANSKLRKLFATHPRAFIGSLIVIAVILIVFLLPHHKATKTGKSQVAVLNTAASKQMSPQQNYLGTELNDLAVKLANIQQKLTSGNIVNLDPITQQLADLAKQSQDLAAKSNDLIKDQIETSTKELTAKLSVIKKQLTKLEDAQKHIRYLKPSNLPFTVIALDNIQQNNVVTIRYNHTTMPLTIGDYLAGWKLINADFANQKCEFVNQKGQHVVVDLNFTEIKSRS